MVVHSGYDGWWRGGDLFVIAFYGMFHLKKKWGQNAGCQCAYIQYYAVREYVGTRRVNSFKKRNNGYNDVAIMNSSWNLHYPTDVLL